MRFGEIIKKAWTITWRYKWLWVLGMFAGITGGSGGGSGGNSSGYRQSFGSGSGGDATAADFSRFLTGLEHWLPFIIAMLVAFFIIGIAFAIIGIGARGGLIWAVNEIEEGRVPRLGQSWNAGFARFWSLFGLAVLLQLPILAAVLVLVFVVAVPVVQAVSAGARVNPGAMIAPVCGVLAIGVPLLIVASIVLGIMYITGTRFVMLYGMGAVQSAGEGWRAFRARLGDHLIMYVISIALSFAASFALVIPMLFVAVATIVPGALSAASGRWGGFAGSIGVFIVLAMVLGFAFTAVWGTFTSAMWTVFFRRLTGRELLAPIAPPMPAPADAYAGYPVAPPAGPPMAPPPAAPPVAPPAGPPMAPPTEPPSA